MVAITSQVPAQLASDEFSIPAGELAGCGLPKPSILRLNKVVALHQRLVIKRIGSLSAATLEVVMRCFKEQF